MVEKIYIPKRGDLVWLNFNPQAGKEQANKRPALVLSPAEYNRKTGLALMCPMTSKIKEYPFEVGVKAKKFKGVILSDQIRNLDWKVRQAHFVEKLPKNKVKDIQNKIISLLTG